MHCQDCLANLDLPANARKIVLAGNPNVGKSVFFNAFTGMYVDVSNFPGTTVDISHGRYGQDVVIDTPGVYGISSFNDEEIVARDVILAADLIVNVVDAVHLERDLFLTLQLIDTGIPVLVAMNLMDEAVLQGLKIDTAKLEELLGVPVIAAVAVKGQGLEEVKKRLWEARRGKVPAELQQELDKIGNTIGSQAEALLVLEGDPHVSERHGLNCCQETIGEFVKEKCYAQQPYVRKQEVNEEISGRRERIYQERRRRVNDIVGKVLQETQEKARFSTRLGRYMLRPLTGIPIFCLVLFAMYYLIGVIVAQDIVGFTEDKIMQAVYEPAIRGFVSYFINEESMLGIILVGEFGLLTMTVTYILGLLLPLVVGFYLALSVMEDSGYLPRLATLVDRLMNSIGLNGRAVIPLILGFGCVTMATITTRILGTKRERTIATAVLGLAIPCSAQLGVIAGMLAGLGPKLVAVYVAVILLVLGLVGKVLHSVLPGQSSDLMIDLPPLRLPRPGNVCKKTLIKSYAFLLEATPLFMAGALLISALQLSGFLSSIQVALAPVTEGLLLLPRETATAFIMGLIRRDFGAAGLSDMPLSPEQVLVSLVTITLFVPCVASMIVMFKERGAKEGTLIWVGSWVMAFLLGGVVARIVM